MRQSGSGSYGIGLPTRTPGMRDLVRRQDREVRELALLAGPLIWSSHYRAKPAHYRASLEMAGRRRHPSD
ncbi:MAG: hypothetical protein ACXVH3_33195 [Solirubrobacteraceae bacterium]